jgi:hypothetical protein
MLRLFVLSLAAAAALAQTSTSSISGTITDSTSAVVANASVTASNEATGVQYRQQSTATGLYSFPSLPIGSYRISVEVAGFKTAVRTGNLLQVGSPIVVDVQLEVGLVTETVSVEAAAEQLRTSNAAIGNVVERKAIVNLPLNGRNPLNLLILEPGVVQRTQGGAGSGIHVNGSRDRATNTTIDGIEANESSVPNPLGNTFRLNPDMVQEYKVTTSNPTPEEGRNSGASVSVATRSGTNQLHGTAYHFFRNTALNARDFFSNALDSPKPEIKLNQYGFELGGPIRRNKTFFFGSWQGQHINFAQPIDQVFGAPGLYTPDALAGRWRYFRPNPNNPFVLDGARIDRNQPQLVDPRTGALRPGVRTCGSETDLSCIATYTFAAADPSRVGLDPAISRLLSSYPTPNSYVDGDGLNLATYNWNPPTRVRGPHIMARIDHVFNDNNTVFGRYLFGDQNTLGGDPNNSRPQVFPNFPPLGEVFRRSHNLAVSWRRVISPTMVNELTAGFSRFFFLFTQGEANPAFPNIPPYDFANISEPFLNRPRTNRAITTPQILNNFSIVRGSHQMRMGFNFRFYQHNDQRGQPGGVNVTPVLSFSRTIRPPAGFDIPRTMNSLDSNNLQQAINELLGIPARLTQVFLGDLRSDRFLPFRSGDSVTLWAQGQRLKQYNFYVQDEWKLRRNVTVNYGVRWELNTAPSEAGDRVYVPKGNFEGPDLVSFVPADRWYGRNNARALAPRLGLTWSPGSSGRTVIRTGYGMAFDPISSFQVTAVAGRVPGLTTTCQSNPGGTTTAGCAPAPDIRIGQGFPEELAPPAVKPSSFLTLPRQTLNNAPAITVFDQNLKLPTVHQWNMTVQRELPKGFVVQAGYVGSRGTRLLRAYDLNQINADPILNDFRIMQSNLKAGCRPDGTTCPGGAAGQRVPLVANGVLTAAFVNSAATQNELNQNAAGQFAGRIEQTTLALNLRPNQQFGIVTYLDAAGDSYYHSFQSSVRKRFTASLQVGAAYALAKSIDNQSLDPVGSTSGGGLSTTNSRTPADIRNWRNERAVSDFDRRHVFNAIALYELPWGKNKLWGGWSLNGILSVYAGEPFTVQSGVRTSNNSHVSRAALVAASPESRLQNKANTVGPAFFPDKAAFTFPEPGGNGIGRNTFRAAGYWNSDIALQKNFVVTERFKVQFRMETFNTFNHPSFESPTSASSGSNQITSNRFGEACCEAVAPASTQNIIQTGESGRVVQFGLKLLF